MSNTKYSPIACELEKDKKYRTLKIDPGFSFMKEVRKATKKLNFKEIPNS